VTDEEKKSQSSTPTRGEGKEKGKERLIAGKQFGAPLKDTIKGKKGRRDKLPIKRE